MIKFQLHEFTDGQWPPGAHLFYPPLCSYSIKLFHDVQDEFKVTLSEIKTIYRFLKNYSKG